MQTQYALPGNAGFAVPARQSGRPFRRPIRRAERIWERGLSDVERQAPGAAFLRRSGRSGSGFQPAMMRAHSLAWTLSTMPGKRRRSSTAADSSPRCSKTARIAAASASDTTNMPGAWERRLGLSKRYLGYPWAADVSMCQQASPIWRVSRPLRNRSGDLSNAWPCSTELGAAFEPGLAYTPRHPDG